MLENPILYLSSMVLAVAWGMLCAVEIKSRALSLLATWAGCGLIGLIWTTAR